MGALTYEVHSVKGLANLQRSRLGMARNFVRALITKLDVNATSATTLERES